MAASFIKTSLYTHSLLSSPPAALPQIPTLAELKERVESIPISIPSASFSDPKHSLPAYSNSPPPKYKKGWSFSSKMMKIAPNQVQGSVPGERNVPAIEGSGGYLKDVKGAFGQQPEIDDIDADAKPKGWFSWIPCRS